MSELFRDAACRDVDPELMFPMQVADQPYAPVAPADRAQAEAARFVCSGCPVRDACLMWALDTRQGYGVWGGLTADERAAVIWTAA